MTSIVTEQQSDRIGSVGTCISWGASIKATVRSTYVIIDIYHRKVGDLVDADVDQMEDGYRRFRLVYSERGSTRCLYENHQDAKDGIYAGNFLKMAAKDLLVLTHQKYFVTFSIDCSVEIFKGDDRTINKCLQNRTKFLHEFNQELGKAPVTFKIDYVKLRVVEVTELIDFIKNFGITDLGDLRLNGVKNCKEQLDVINLEMLRGVEQWLYVDNFSASNLLCTAKAIDIRHLVNCDILVRSFDNEEIINLGEAFSTKKRFKKAVINSITDFDWNFFDGELQEEFSEESEIVRDQKEDQNLGDNQKVVEGKEVAEVPQHSDDKVDLKKDAAKVPQQEMEAPVPAPKLYKEKMFDNGVRCRMYKNILVYKKI